MVDDSHDICFLVKLVLEPEGHEVIEAHTGEEGLEFLESGGCDVLLLDINLPGINGWEVLERLAELEGTRPRVVVMSAAAEHTFPEHFRKSGTATTLPKPFSTDDLVEVVAHASSS